MVESPLESTATLVGAAAGRNEQEDSPAAQSMSKIEEAPSLIDARTLKRTAQLFGVIEQPPPTIGAGNAGRFRGFHGLRRRVKRALGASLARNLMTKSHKST